MHHLSTFQENRKNDTTLSMIPIKLIQYLLLDKIMEFIYTGIRYRDRNADSKYVGLKSKFHQNVAYIT